MKTNIKAKVMSSLVLVVCVGTVVLLLATLANEFGLWDFLKEMLKRM